MSGSCPYANILGVPGKGIHAPRILGLAYNDTLLTIALICVTTVFSGVSIWLVALFWFLVGELAHVAFGSQTAFLTMIGIKACD